MKKLLIVFLLCCSMAGAQEFLPFSPVGEIKMYGGLIAPSGFLLCDGTLASDTAYPKLSAVIKAQYARTGDPTDSFRVPDLRGVFPKGFGQNGVLGSNYANASGTPQADKFQGHYHRATYGGLGASSNAAQISGGASSSSNDTIITTPITDGTNGTPRTGAITEPANVGVSFIIKY